MTDPEAAAISAPKEAELLSFKPTGRPLALEQIEAEFRLMRSALKQPLTDSVARRICEKSGTHLLKLVSPRADGDHACLYFEQPGANQRPALLPSTNAPDIPFCKLIYRPLEIIGHSSRSVVDHVVNPEEISAAVLKAFGNVFGADVVETIRITLTASSKRVSKLAAGEFPIIFVPRPGGGDLQVTPVSLAASFMAMKRVREPYFQKAQSNAPKPPPGRWTRQAISSKPQNISGAIGGPRVRFLATMPPSLRQEEVALYRYIRGGRFPRWTDDSVGTWLLRYADMLERDATFNNRDTRQALDSMADRLIREADEFIGATSTEARLLAERHGFSEESLPEPPDAPAILLRRLWASDKDYNRARWVLSSSHFIHRLQVRRKAKEA